jgi:hypothetical protein
MPIRGELLELVDGAPGGLSTLQGALTTWMHRDLAAKARERTMEQAETGNGLLATVAALGDRDHDPAEGAPPGVGVSVGEGSTPTGPGPGSGHSEASSPTRGGAVDDGPERVTSWYVVVAMPDRWRVVGRGHLAVSDGRRSWAGTSTLVTERDSARAAIHDAGAIGACLYPGALLGGLELAMPEIAELEGRPCWLVDAQPRTEVLGTSLATSAAPHALRLHRDLVGVEHRMWFDTATGILLRHEGYVDGERCSWTALSDLVFDAPVAGDEFRPPPGAVVRSRHELLRDHLSEMGIDPDTVDLDDPAQVRDALRQGG